MNDTITSEELNNNLQSLNSTPIESKEPSYNLIYLNTPTGRMIIKTHLTDKEWLVEHNLKLKNNKNNKTKKTKRK